MRLFVYGTLLHAETLARRAGDSALSARLVPAALPGWRRVALRGERYPTLRRHRGGMVRGAVLTVPARALARLTAYEVPAYRLTRVVVVISKRKTIVQTWIAPGGTRHLWEN